MSIFSSLFGAVASGWDHLTSIVQGDNADSQGTAFNGTPGYADVCVVRALLKSFGLPTEIVLEILNYAEYEPRYEISNTIPTTATAELASRYQSRHIHAQACIAVDSLGEDMMRELDAKSGKAKIKEIEFSFQSQDQGWTSEPTVGTFNTSSWLEVSIIRPNERNSSFNSQTPFLWGRDHQTLEDLERRLQQHGAAFVRCSVNAEDGAQGGEGPLAWHLQSNRVTVPEEYRVLWTADSHEGNEGAGVGKGFINALQAGDVIVVWARAQYPGWRCTVNNIQIAMRFSFNE